MAEEIEFNVKSDIGELTNKVEKLDKNIKETGKSFKKTGKDAKKAKEGATSFSKSLEKIGKASGIIFLLEKAFSLLKETLGKNQIVVDFFSTSMNSLTVAFSDLFSFIQNNIGTVTTYFTELFNDPVQSIKDFGTAIKDNLIERFMSFLDTIGFLASAVKKLFAKDFQGALDDVKKAGIEMIDVYTGVDNSVDKFTKTIKDGTKAIIDYTTKTINKGKAITESAKAAERSITILARLNKQFAADALIQEQIVNNELLSFKDRFAALKELERLTEINNKAQVAAQKLKVKTAQNNVDLNASEANLNALRKEQNTLMDITAQNLANENELFELKILLNDQWNEKNFDDKEIEKQQEEDLFNFKKELREKAFQALGSNIDASMKELEGAYSKEKRLAEANGKSTEDIDKKYEQKRVALANKQKAFKVAEALITTFQMANAAYKSGLEAGGPAGVVLGPIAAAVAAAAGLANVRSIMAQDVGAGTGGGGGGGVVTSDTPAPQMMSGAFDLSGGVAPDPVQAFVLTDEMTNSQNQLANIRRRATI